jgi:uncharacterized membrane protein YcaP (DUF421 family)
MENIFFDNWQTLWRTLIIGGFAYLTLLLLLRISGRRTLSKMNAFDLVVTVSLGSTLATILLNKDVALAEGALALALLIGMQFIVTWTSVRVSWFKKLITGEPALLFYQGQHLSAALKHSRVTREEIKAAARAAGFDDLSDIGAIVLETDGSFSVLKKGDERSYSTLQDLSTFAKPGK